MPQTESAARAALASEGLEPHSWSNSPGFRYEWHEHRYHKVLYCVEGSITFHTDGGDRELKPGDRLDLPPGTRHAATVGPAGVTCLEAARA
jgi:quercetin dioxygenase-like cupin family protein